MVFECQGQKFLIGPVEDGDEDLVGWINSHPARPCTRIVEVACFRHIGRQSPNTTYQQVRVRMTALKSPEAKTSSYWYLWVLYGEALIRVEAPSKAVFRLDRGDLKFADALANFVVDCMFAYANSVG